MSNNSHTRIIAMWWHCDDGICDCWQPRIVKVFTQPRFRQTNWKALRIVEAGPFHSQPENDEWQDMKLWLEQKCAEYKLELPK